MPLQKQIVPYNFTKGIDTKTDEYQVSGKLLTLENGVFQTTGAVRKRNGYAKIGLNGSPSIGNAIAAYKNAPKFLPIIGGKSIHGSLVKAPNLNWVDTS